MTDAGKSSFVYVTYIRTTPERLWSALTSQDFAQQYWRGAYPDAEWKVGGSWKLVLHDGRLADSGEIVAFEPCKRLGIRWRNEFKPELKAVGYTRCVMEIELADYYPDRGGKAVKLTITHEAETGQGAPMIEAVSSGWPKVLSNLKSLLETGDIAFKA